MPFLRAYDKQNLTLVVNTYKIYETSYEMTIRERSSISMHISSQWAHNVGISMNFNVDLTS